jgi:uncharacterized OB-fold protein
LQAETDFPEILPIPDALTRPYWDGAASGRLVLQRCDRCDRFWHFPVPLCPTCHQSDRLGWREVSGEGVIYSYVVIHHTRMPAFAEKLPYVVVCVELIEQEGLRLFANLLEFGPNEVRVGTEVEVCFQRVAATIALPQFRPRSATRQK